MQDLPLARVRQSLQTLLSNLRRAATEVEDAINQLGIEADLPASGIILPTPRPRTLQLDRAAFAVRWGTKTCHLGHSVLFRVMEVLVRHPDQYISRERLLDLAWHGSRSDSTVRSAIGELRARLAKAGLHEVAAAIDGRNLGHYRLRLTRARRPKGSNSNPTRIRLGSDSAAGG
jgi:DNA-binding response OmpR family regulator